ncbi:hypothetical protein [Myroides sp. TSA_177.3]|uniref:hypothetical protein n=1 Tax=Myroides sp. TSA_177.3 TaxID=3415650 RepID=UPI0040452096
MNWQPITLEELHLEIQKGENKMTAEQLLFWKEIRIVPEKWVEHTLGKEGGSFWVIAQYNHKVLYYNDIEEGFNCSTFVQKGIIDYYGAAQDELQWALDLINIQSFKSQLYIDDMLIGSSILSICDETMGVLSGYLVPNEQYKKFQSAIFTQFDQKGISALMDFNYQIILEDTFVLHPQGGIGITHSRDFPEEIVIETAGNTIDEIMKLR